MDVRQTSFNVVEPVAEMAHSADTKAINEDTTHAAPHP